ncbi:ExbD/TolR family protein [Flavihumibacter stibioxidans]|uniref:Biopolymer transporter ExbD n=1 Tax=Flavihumibacter stibioxidans TaxID=1834163 RepID=A0ABR7MCS3_9BACT|nr:biopolymer transporter ExbD [Flavihumibacter stibioxidans]MBC6492752.1 hypothetical protein [Flavihumibacter stibioxidans]
MAELQTSSTPGGGRKGITRSKKLSTRVDLTPMVDLGFLLITFFIFTTTMEEQTAMRLNLPADGSPTNVGESATLTLIPTGNDSVLYFHGSLEQAKQDQALGITGYQLNHGVGDLIREKQAALALTGKKKDFNIIIHPDQSASYKNIVDLMDEMLINAVPAYCLADDMETVKQAGYLIAASGKHPSQE